MNLDTAKAILANGGFTVQDESRLPNGTGTQLRLQSGQIVNVFDKGTYNVQGRKTDSVKKILDGAASDAPSVPQTARQVFVVYGHDTRARDQLEAMLRRWGITPLILDQLASQGMTLIEKLEHYRGQVQYGVVLATPDDEGHRAGNSSEKAFRARQNVVLELGMLLAVLGRPRVAILLKAQEKMERPSDIQGLIYIPFKDQIDEAKLLLAKEMNSQGIPIDLGKL